MPAAKPTINHKQIQKWVEAHGGYPAHVKKTGKKNDPGILRIDFPGFSGEDTLERISWDEWFDAFDRKGLAHLEQQGRGRFNKLVSRSSVSATTTRSRTAAPSRTSSKKK